MLKLLSKNQGKKTVLLGNNAIVRGALESGVQFVSTYPGTPASEIGDTFAEISKKAGIYFEYSTNEKVALEVGAGASFSGLKTLVAMKNFGLNVASDFLLPLIYSGVKAGMVIAVVDDPGCSSSAQSEENTRAFAYLAHIPILEPSSPQECKEFTKIGFEISEKFKIPIMLRATTRVALQGGIVVFDKIKKGKTKGNFVKNPHQFVTMPPRVLEMKKELFGKIEKIKKEISEKSSLNKIFEGKTFKDFSKNSSIGIITSGVSFLYAMEALKELNLNIPVLKLGFFYPLAENKIKNFIKGLDKVLIIEELEPYLEKEVERISKNENPKLKIFGKDLLSEIGELKPENVIEAVAKVAERKWKIIQPKIPDFLKRRPQLCSGCPYWLVFGAVKRAVDVKKVIFGGEIGCYMMANLPPHNIQDYLFCMGSSVSLAHGIKKASGQKIISFVGDSSFFHAGIPALINAVHNKSNPLIIIMQNGTTAMTGQQSHPGVEKMVSGELVPRIEIEGVVKACGVKNLKIIDPIKQEELVKVIKNFLNKEEISVIIVRRPCINVK